MPKGPSSNFFVEVSIYDPVTGKPIYAPDGKRKKKKVRMDNGRFHDGTEQEFYYGEGHERAGQFKGMAKILEERGYDIQGKKAQCTKRFADCLDVFGHQCCCRRMLYNEPDFDNVVSALEEECHKWGFRVLFLPKFHCELNFIEQCWGHAKRRYRLFPLSSREDVLERNVTQALNEVPLLFMRR